MPSNVTYADPPDAAPSGTPFPMGELRADDEGDLDFLMLDALRWVPPVEAPASVFWSVYRLPYTRARVEDPFRRIAYTPLNQNNCHAEADRGRKDPLGCGHCVGFGSKHLLLCRPITNVALALTGSDVYHRAQELDEWAGEAYQGTSARAGMKVLQEKGFISNYVWTNREDVVKTWIRTIGPVGVSFNWREQMFWPKYADGWTLRLGGPVVGGHFLVADGYDAATDRYRLLNSWGMWGTNGRAYLRAADMRTLLAERPTSAVSPTELLVAA